MSDHSATVRPAPASFSRWCRNQALVRPAMFAVFIGVLVVRFATRPDRIPEDCLPWRLWVRVPLSGRPVITETLATEGSEAAAAAAGWTRLTGRGVRIRRVGNYWIKEVDPEASRLAQWYGRGTIKAQAKGLERLRDMAPDFLYRDGKIITRHAGEFEGGVGDFLRTWAKGSWRLRTPFNDIRLRNIGEGGIIFDPSLHPLEQAALAGATGYGTYRVVDYATSDE